MTTAITVGPPPLFDYKIEENSVPQRMRKLEGGLVEWQPLDSSGGAKCVSEALIKRGLLQTTVLFALLPAVLRSVKAAVHQATLFSHLGHKEAGSDKSAYNFYAMARNDQWPGVIKNQFHLIYGSVSLNHDSD
jgi:hypothetical protein